MAFFIDSDANEAKAYVLKWSVHIFLHQGLVLSNLLECRCASVTATEWKMHNRTLSSQGTWMIN